MGRRGVVAGVGMIPFTTPGKTQPYDVMGETAARKAISTTTACSRRPG